MFFFALCYSGNLKHTHIYDFIGLMKSIAYDTFRYWKISTWYKVVGVPKTCTNIECTDN